MTLNEVFRTRYRAAGWIYVAGSLKGHIIKIGVTTQSIRRYQQCLRTRKHGNFDDWEILYCFYVKVEAARIEHDALRSLRRYKEKNTYRKDGHPQKGREMFRCSFSMALEAVTIAAGNLEKSNEWHSSRGRHFEFGRHGTSPTYNEVSAIKVLSSLNGRLPCNIEFLKRVDELELSTRTASGLKIAKINYLGDLVGKCPEELLRIPSFGRRSLNEIVEVLGQIGLRLGIEILGWPPEKVDILSECFALIFFERLDEFDLTVATATGLQRRKIEYVGDLVQCSAEDLLLIPNFGRRSLNEVETVLAKIGLRLGMVVPEWKFSHSRRAF
jgi:RNA polymerase alpha subunit/T5orf172 domain-containing protein